MIDLAKCQFVIDENVIIFFVKDEGDSSPFMKEFIMSRSIFCLNEKLYRRYWGHLEELGKDYSQINFFKVIKRVLIDSDRIEYCPEDVCGEGSEHHLDFLDINQKDRFLLPIARFFDRPIVSQDGPLKSEIDRSDRCKVECIRPAEGLAMILA